MYIKQQIITNFSIPHSLLYPLGLNEVVYNGGEVGAKIHDLSARVLVGLGMLV